MDFEQISRSLLPLLGGKENIASAAHCATRLRLCWSTTRSPISRRLAKSTG
ncbi:PTS system protein [Klebsiella pneumoniae]|uniref:PTS system protein n=1 Tax=Klebsiella pneumoniae TaxID=573 RepID=A0A447S2C2_KLEPN|nr:PTS system protein [Klebsiella pneumoniae]